MRALSFKPVELELLAAFNLAGIRNLVIGGHAVVFHGRPRPAKDLDLFIQAEPQNAESVT